MSALGSQSVNVRTVYFRTMRKIYIYMTIYSTGGTQTGMGSHSTQNRMGSRSTQNRMGSRSTQNRLGSRSTQNRLGSRSLLQNKPRENPLLSDPARWLYQPVSIDKGLERCCRLKYVFRQRSLNLLRNIRKTEAVGGQGRR